MKFVLLSFLFFGLSFFSTKLHSQNYALVDSIVDNYPKYDIGLEDISSLIAKDFYKEEDKARAVFKWVTSNISFDVELGAKMDFKSLKAFSYSTEEEKIKKEKVFKTEVINQTFRTRKTVCHGYAFIVEYLCKKLGLEVEVVTGTLKTTPSEIGIFPNTINHAWNVIKINGQWKFVDATLGAGFISTNSGLFKFDFNDGYFFTNSELFFLNHYPSNEKWLLIAKNRNDFAKPPFYFGNYFKYNYRIIGPESGIYSKKKSNFSFTVKGIDEYDSVQYILNSNEKTLLEQDYTKEFVIDLSNATTGYLSILINDRTMLVYKITD